MPGPDGVAGAVSPVALTTMTGAELAVCEAESLIAGDAWSLRATRAEMARRASPAVPRPATGAAVVRDGGRSSQAWPPCRAQRSRP